METASYSDLERLLAVGAGGRSAAGGAGLRQPQALPAGQSYIIYIRSLEAVFHRVLLSGTELFRDCTATTL